MHARRWGQRGRRRNNTLVHFVTEVEVERGSNHGNRAELADRIAAWCYRVGQDVSAKLLLERKSEKLRQRQTHAIEFCHTRRKRTAEEAQTTECDPGADRQRAGDLDRQLEPKNRRYHQLFDMYRSGRQEHESKHCMDLTA